MNKTKTNDNWSKVAAVAGGLAVVSAFAAPAVMNNNDAPVINEVNQTSIEDAVKNAVNSAMVNLNGSLVEIQKGVDYVNSEDVLDDAWEAKAEFIAEDEFSERDYRFIANDMNIDKDDINRVIIRDVDVTDLDTDDKNATVMHELRVYYEDTNGDSKRQDMNVETVIVDNEIFSQNVL